MPKSRKLYPSDLTDLQWKHIEKHIPNARRGGRPRTTDVRQIVNAIFFVTRTGCAWRYLPRSYPPWPTVYEYFCKWRLRGIWKIIHENLLRQVRETIYHKNPEPSALIIDSQSIRAALGANRGYDGFKRLRGRKRHILVDTLGLIHSVKVHAANHSDRSEGYKLFRRFPVHKESCLKAIYADHGYRGRFVDQIKTRFGFRPKIPPLRRNSGQGRRKTAKQKLANRRLRKTPRKRWVVERTFAWFNHYRRLSKDYERNPSHSESMVYLAMTQLMLRRLCGMRSWV